MHLMNHMDQKWQIVENLSLNKLYIKSLNAFLTFTYHEASIVELQIKNAEKLP